MKEHYPQVMIRPFKQVRRVILNMFSKCLLIIKKLLSKVETIIIMNYQMMKFRFSMSNKSYSKDLNQEFLRQEKT